MEKRRHRRTRCRFPCDIESGSEQATGTVLNISTGGLSVRTDLHAEEGTPLEVTLRFPQEGCVLVETIVWNTRRVRQRKTGEEFVLLGLVLSAAPSAYFDLLPESTPSEADDMKEEVKETRIVSNRRLFVVRMRARAGNSRTRLVRLEADSPESAAALAAERLGDHWEVIEVHAR